MYTKDKSVRLTLRLNQAQFDFVKENADILDVSPSEFLRMVVNATMSTSKKVENNLAEVLGRENDKTHSNNLV